MSAERILITGGAGLIGSHIAELLAQDPKAPEVVILDNFVGGSRENLAGINPARLRVIEGDIRDSKTVSEAMKGVDYVFHQAAILITRCAQEPRLAMDVLVNGTFNVLEAAVQHKVKKVVAASSASVYGLADKFPIPETQHPYNNRTLYGAAKAFSEGMMRSFNEMYGLSYVGLRYFSVYGPRMNINGVYTEVLVRWIECIENGQAPVIFGEGKNLIDYVYVQDVARANVLAMRAPASDKVFNVASGVEISLKELAGVLARVMGSDLQPEHRPERKANAVARRVADTTAAQRDLGFRTQVPIEEGMRRLVAWWRTKKNQTKAETILV